MRLYRQFPHSISRALHFPIFIHKAISILMFFKICFYSFEESIARTNDLEVEVWMSSDSELVSNEKKIISHIQQKNHLSFYYYLLSHTYMRMFILNPDRVDLIAKATELSEQAVLLQPDQEFGYLATAEILEVLGKNSQSIELTKSLEKSLMGTVSWRVKCTLARLSKFTDNATHILNSFDTCLKQKDVKNEIILPYVVDVIESYYNPTNISEVLNEWNNKYPSVEFVILDAENQVALGNYKSAEFKYKEIIKTYHTNIEAKINYASLCYTHLDKFDQAQQTLESLLKNKHLLSDDYKFVVMFHLGKNSLLKKNYKDANDYFLESIHFSKDKNFILDYISKSYSEINEPKEYVSYLNLLTVELPGRFEIYAYLGEVYMLQLKNYNLAVESFNNAILLNPRNINLYSSIGLAFYHLKMFDHAIKNFNIVLKMNPDDAMTLYNKACVLSLSNKKEEALKALSKALESNPTLKEKAISDQDFDRLKSSSDFIKMVQL